MKSRLQCTETVSPSVFNEIRQSTCRTNGRIVCSQPTVTGPKWFLC